MTPVKWLRKRKSIAENTHSSAPIRVASGHLYSQNILAETFGCCFGFLLLSLQTSFVRVLVLGAAVAHCAWVGFELAWCNRCRMILR
jgi:hypothetical protein